MDSVFEPGEIVHVVEHRRFQDDIRRHFVGRVDAATETTVRVTGYLFLYERQEASFVRSPALRTRVFAVDNSIGITVLPAGTDLEALAYRRDNQGLALSDGESVRIDIGVFGPHG